MRCDVCDTKLPLGKYECPNCGMRMKDNYVSSFDVGGDDHNHIQVSKATDKKVRNQKKIVLNPSSRPKAKEKKPGSKIALIIFAIYFIFIFFTIISVLFSNVFDIIQFGYSDYEHLELSDTFEELESEYNLDLSQIINERDKAIDYIDDRYDNVELYQSADEDYAGFSVGLVADSVQYGIEYIQYSDDYHEIDVFIRFDSDSSIEDENIFDIADYDIVSYLCEYIDVTYDESIFTDIEEDFNGDYSSVNYDGYRVWYTETDLSGYYYCILNIYNDTY